MCSEQVTYTFQVSAVGGGTANIPYLCHPRCETRRWWNTHANHEGERAMIRARAANFFDDDDADGAPAPTWIMGIPYTGTSKFKTRFVIPPLHLHTLFSFTLYHYTGFCACLLGCILSIACRHAPYLQSSVLLAGWFIDPSRLFVWNGSNGSELQTPPLIAASMPDGSM